MAREFKPNLILHIEDDPAWRMNALRWLGHSDELSKAYGGSLKYTEVIIYGRRYSCASSKTDFPELEQTGLEIKMREIFSHITNEPILLGLDSGQVARTLLETHLPGAIISDTGFPLNGQKTVQYLMAHGYQNYPLIGLSSTSLGELDPAVVQFFMTNNARYFLKGATLNWDDLIKQLIFNRGFNIQTFGQQKS
jgi:hypothetical protein